MDVLIADGSAFTRRLLREVLADVNGDVYEAENGVEAIEQYEANDPALVVMEAEMSIRDGIEATAELTSTDPSATVVVCTREHDMRTRDRAIEAGAAGYLTKPFQKAGLLEEIEAAMDSAGSS